MKYFLLLIASLSLAIYGGTKKVLILGDTQYLAEERKDPEKLNPLSEEARQRLIEKIKNIDEIFPNSKKSIEGVIILGDLIDSADKNGKMYESMQKFEWDKFLEDFSVDGKNSNIPYPSYELNGNHDGPQSEGFIIDDIKKRNKKRVNLKSISKNGIQYSWEVNGVLFINLGMFAGREEKRKEKHHYAAKSSLDFLELELKRHASKGQPVIVSHHLHLQAGDYDWPDEDLKEYFSILKEYNVIAILHGHTHGSPSRFYYWNGDKIYNKSSKESKRQLLVIDADDCCAAKLYNGKAVGLFHSMVICEIKEKSIIFEAAYSKDNWKTLKPGFRIEVPKDQRY